MHHLAYSEKLKNTGRLVPYIELQTIVRRSREMRLSAHHRTEIPKRMYAQSDIVD